MDLQVLQTPSLDNNIPFPAAVEHVLVKVITGLEELLVTKGMCDKTE